jgi:hypothetical protein
VVTIYVFQTENERYAQCTQLEPSAHLEREDERSRIRYETVLAFCAQHVLDRT